LLDEALFTTPVHPEWSGAALVGEDSRLVGIGSLLVQEAVGDDVVKGTCSCRPTCLRRSSTIFCGRAGPAFRRGRG
jgi:hypothetical protein